LTDVLRGEVTMMFSQFSTAKPLIATGELRALGVASKVRSAARYAGCDRWGAPTAHASGDVAGTCVTTPDGVTLKFGEPEPTEATNPWLADLDKVTKQ
jgi:tripartite-type tricarboxylate transporter receptor subunit TctC